MLPGRKDPTDPQAARVLGAAFALVICASLVLSLWFKAPWRWMDEVLSQLLISDPSWVHFNRALVSGMDANPPLFPNLYWTIGHLISLNPTFLRSVSVVLFAVALMWFYRFVCALLGNARTTLVLMSLVIALTYLNLTLSTQIRAYSLFFLAGCAYFIAAFRLCRRPASPGALSAHFFSGIFLVFTHDFGLFYAATSAAFFAALLVWSRDRKYLAALASHAACLAAWWLLWFPRFAIQAQAGKPHSWIPVPTLRSFFFTAGELLPAISSRLEHHAGFGFLAPLRFLAIAALFIVIAVPRLRHGFAAAAADPAFLFYLFSGWMFFGTIVLAAGVSAAGPSVFLSRYLWPGHLLAIYQLRYAYGWATGGRVVRPSSLALAAYLAVVGGFLFLQNRKLIVFPSGIVPCVTGLQPNYPVFVETADYFLPIWSQCPDIPVRHVLDWPAAAREGNPLSATVEYRILAAVRANYGVTAIVPSVDFTPSAYPHFYYVEEQPLRLLRNYLARGEVRIVRRLPMAIPGHSLLECEWRIQAATGSAPAPLKRLNRVRAWPTTWSML